MKKIIKERKKKNTEAETGAPAKANNTERHPPNDANTRPPGRHGGAAGRTPNCHRSRGGDTRSTGRPGARGPTYVWTTQAEKNAPTNTRDNTRK